MSHLFRTKTLLAFVVFFTEILVLYAVSRLLLQYVSMAGIIGCVATDPGSWCVILFTIMMILGVTFAVFSLIARGIPRGPWHFMLLYLPPLLIPLFFYKGLNGFILIIIPLFLYSRGMDAIYRLFKKRLIDDYEHHTA